MIRMVVALPAEARPLIAHFGLERLNQADPLAIYHRSDIALIVSGPGSDAAARAVPDLCEAAGCDSPCSWINVGVAGHRTLEVGTAVLAVEVISETASKPIYLAPPDLSCETGSVLTVDRIELGFEGESLYEMEAFGFCSAAMKRSDRSLVQVLKIISDNLETGAGAVSARAVQSLIESAIPLIDRLVYQQNRAARQVATRRNREPPEADG
ncbi:MAG: hypothetical protein P8Y44_05225 [Acidobacteriota bacterium]